MLDEVGIHIVAAQLGVAPKHLAYDREGAMTQVYSPHLLHHTEVNDFFTRLAEEAGGKPGRRLRTWLGERGCRQVWRDLVRPDGFGVLEAGAKEASFLLELDGGTEIRSRLARKLEACADLAGTPEAPDALVFCFPSSEREASARAILAERRRKLLELYYADKLSPEGFAEEEARLSSQIEAVRREREEREAERARLSEVAAKFEEVARVLREMDVDRLWAVITDVERRVLVEEMLESVAMFPDHLEVTVSGAPRLNVTLDEVGLTGGGWQFRGVGGPTRTINTPALVRGEIVLAA